MGIWVLIQKDLLVLSRDRLTLAFLFILPVAMILVLGLLVEDTLFATSEDRMLVSMLVLDQGNGVEGKSWGRIAAEDFELAPNLKLELLSSLEQARKLVQEHKRPAVIVLHSGFSDKINQCSFLKDGINPFHRDGVFLEKLDVEVLKDLKQPASAAIMQQVAQVSLLRVVLPYMIGKAFEKLGDPAFIELLGSEVSLPVPPALRLLIPKEKLTLGELLELAAAGKVKMMNDYRENVGAGIQNALSRQFRNYNLTGKTWASLTKSPPSSQDEPAPLGSVLPKKSLIRFQVFVPSLTVLFAFGLIFVSGWNLLAEVSQGTLLRLFSSRLSTLEIFLGKILPTMLMAFFQIGFLVLVGVLFLGIQIGEVGFSHGYRLALVGAFLFALSLCVASISTFVGLVSKNETHLMLFGGVIFLFFGILGGCVFPWEIMPDYSKSISFLTPQGWALDGFRELLAWKGQESFHSHIFFNSCLVLLLIGGCISLISLAVLVRMRKGVWGQFQ